ncbi:GNAT family N-acetyltransferase [Bacillus sp. JJ1773]|uniref:GNAT family N-acetyltransferase n=1 Tax=Bacillus sp. JJ1773 TaxID=3122965 RepID=UPI002FFE54B9
MNHMENIVTFNELNWDTDFFGVSSAKAILHRALTLNEWNELLARFNNYQFISIMNKNSDPVNAKWIGKYTAAFLADINMQFVKQLLDLNELPKSVTIHQSLKRNNQIFDLAKFQFSKFTEDPEFAKRGGDQVYYQWLINAFDKPDKFYALSLNENSDINGFALFSYSDSACVIELFAVSQNETKSGISSRLFKAVENAAYQRGYNEIQVGTQIRNMRAINFYHKVGCKQVGCHQIYHLWNL